MSMSSVENGMLQKGSHYERGLFKSSALKKMCEIMFNREITSDHHPTRKNWMSNSDCPYSTFPSFEQPPMNETTVN